ncbi:MAG: tetratricopeptide repeat protein [Prevotellaceae bacterium]|jgi:tetratricopeptide (TPR) repeat protein|nr:tetratricopeptide repeat protein [Prevotellaceae bacterium]
MSRAYHNVNAEFNVKFNGHESYKEGVKKADNFMPDEYEEMPPVFAYTYKEIPGKVSGEMDRVIEKCDKLVLKHSITVKPKKPSGTMSKKQREFYNRREFCAVVDDAYLLNGKANMYLHEYEKAIVTFDHILSEYPKSSAASEARIQLAGVLIHSGDPERAKRLLQEASETKKLPKRLRTLLDATYADLFIVEKNYAAAIKYLESALKHEPKKANRIRYYFILSELHKATGQRTQAFEYLNKIIRANPPYNMVFTAQMRKAALYDPKAQGASLRQDMLSMLKDEKNEEYIDQIYFALSQIEKASGNDSLAVDYLNKSVAAESSNDHQRSLAYILLGDYNYQLKHFAGAYDNYTSALALLDREHAQYDSLSQKADGLQKLAENYTIVHTEDSLQRVAAMPAAERDKWVQDMIAAVVAREQQEQEDRRQQQYFRYQQEFGNRGIGNVASAGQSGSWYFYNIASVNAGLSAFNMRWGKRKLEDDWRRKNKQVVTSFDTDSDDETGAPKAGNTLSNKSPEYYLQDVPLTAEALAASNERLSTALFRLGEAYKDDVYEPVEAVKTFRRLDADFPQNDNRASTYFYLYELYTAANNPDSAGYYKQLLVDNYPKTPLAQQLTNPRYWDEQQAEKAAMEQQYENVYAAYGNGRYADADARAQQMIRQFPNSLLQPQLELIRALCTGGGGDIAAYKAALVAITQHYPITEVASKATEIIAELEKKELQYTSPTAAPATPTDSASATALPPTVAYRFADTTHYFGLICEKTNATAPLLFALESFNADAYLDDNLEAAVRDIGTNYAIVVVQGFRTLADAQAYDNAISQTDALAPFFPQDYRRVLISPANLSLLTDSKDVAAYLRFFAAHYLQ